MGTQELDVLNNLTMDTITDTIMGTTTGTTAGKEAIRGKRGIVSINTRIKQVIIIHNKFRILTLIHIIFHYKLMRDSLHVFRIRTHRQFLVIHLIRGVKGRILRFESCFVLTERFYRLISFISFFRSILHGWCYFFIHWMRFLLFDIFYSKPGICSMISLKVQYQIGEKKCALFDFNNISNY